MLSQAILIPSILILDLLLVNFLVISLATKQQLWRYLTRSAKEKLEPFIERSYEELADYVSAYDQKMQMKRENIADRGIWTAKKRYILNVWDSEGVRYKEPKMKIMGLETARSSTPAYFRDKLYEAFKIIISKTNDDLIDFIEKIKQDTKTQHYSDVAFPRGVNGLDKYYIDLQFTKGNSNSCEGALLYNHYLKKNSIRTSTRIFRREKRSSLLLAVPNPIHGRLHFIL